MDGSIPGPMDAVLVMLLVAAGLCHGSASPTISPNVSTLIVNRGDPVTLVCSGNASVEWVEVKNGTKTVLYANGTLYIPRATCNEMMLYQCAYVNRTKEEYASIFLFVRDLEPKWCVPKLAAKAIEGRDAVLPCLVTDPGFAGTVSLLKNSHIVSSRVSFRAQEGIRIHRVKMSDEGWYNCQTVLQGKKTDSKTITLHVIEITEPVSVTIANEDNVRIQGEPFKVSCRISYPSNFYNFTWIHPSNPNVNVTKTEDTDPASGNYITDFTLSIPAVQLQDSGKYTCLGSSSAGSRNSSATLQVVEKGYVRLSTMQNRSQELSLHKSLVLKVFIEAYPRPYIWKWTHVNPSRSSEISTYVGQLISGNNRYNNTLKLNWTEERNSGIYTLFVDNGVASAAITFNISIRTQPTVRMMSNNSSSFWCEASGYPPPRIEWYKVPRLSKSDRCSRGGVLLMNHTNPGIMHEIPFGRVSVKSMLTVDDMEENVTLCCLAVNSVGNASYFSVSSFSSTGQNTNEIPKPLIIVVAGITSFLVLCIIVLFYKYKQKAKYQVRWKIIEASEGNNYIFLDPTQLPYNEKWEFPRNNLQFGKTLGAGAFGRVIEATAFGLGKEDSVMKVAVKMLKTTAYPDEQEALMSELKIMSHLGHHENIVNLLGACTQGGPILVITEYCPYGDLLNFLRNKAECLIIPDLTLETPLDSMIADYKNIYLGKKYIESDSGFGRQGVDSYLEMKPVKPSVSMPPKGRSSVSEEMDDSRPLDLHDLVKFSIQVAQGMAFLTSKNCIHRDLAARNVLLADGRVAKICDFGLARDIMNDTNYVVKGNARLPVKWMAPESIFECVYTVQSDVWSYGILLWEIFSLGRSPYPGMKVNSKFYNLVKHGYHMGRPDFAPEDMYNIMTACWNLEPTQRPTFSQICTFLQKQMNTNKEQDYTNLSSSVEEDSGCEPSIYCEESCESGENGELLLNGNNYQFC
uniref:receptor protein-tyrosine kinase n=1 Tax=Salvator merianae TaxID=96440 RepID=A0A8D0KF15_SALMN